MTDYSETVHELGLLGERLCLDFTNTAGSYPPRADNDFLTGYDRLVEWGEYVGLLTGEDAATLRAVADARPDHAAEALAGAVAFRGAAFRLLAALAAGATPADDDLAALNAALPEALAHLKTGFDAAGGCIRYWTGAPDDLRRVLWPVVWDVNELLFSADRARLRQCASDQCNWLFLDTTRNHSRRWCDMRDCGNREKQRSHYQRTRGGLIP